MHVDQTALQVGLVCALILVAVLAVKLSARTGLPSLLLYLGLGLAVGEVGLGVQFSDYTLTKELGLLALAVILAEGGLTTRWSTVRPVFAFGFVLATVGVLVTVAVIAAGAYFLLDFDVRNALLIGGVVAATDAAAVFSVLRNLPIKPRLSATLEAESGLNDAPAVLLVTLVASDVWGEETIGHAALVGIYQLSAGVAIGALIGLGGRWLLARAALPSSGLYPIATLAITLLAYSLGGIADASGLIATYVAALIIGNSRLPHRRPTIGFAQATALLAQIGLFVMLGLLASPSRLPGVIGAAVVVGIVSVASRPIAVWISALPFRVPLRDQAFLSWAGLRGAVPIVLTTIPVTMGVPGAEHIFDIVFVLVVVFTLIQAPTLPWAARWLGVTSNAMTTDVMVESAPLDAVGAEVLQLAVTPGSHLCGVYVEELQLPNEVVVSMVVRDGSTIVPDRDYRIREGDSLVVVAPRGQRDAAERRLKAVASGGRLAGWINDDDGEDSWGSPRWSHATR